MRTVLFYGSDRQKRQALHRLGVIDWADTPPDIRIKTIQIPSKFKGTLLLLLAQFENGRSCYFSLGELGKPAERVADEAVEALLAFLGTDGALDQYMADQILLPLCLAGGKSQIRTSRITQHLLTNVTILRKFLPTRIEIQGNIDEPGFVEVQPE